MRVIKTLALTCVASPLAAQLPSDGRPRPDTVAQAPASPEHKPIGVWLSAGYAAARVGPAARSDNDLAVHATLWGSYGHAIAGVRVADAGIFDEVGDRNAHDVALLFGARTSSTGSILARSVLASFAVGPGIMHRWDGQRNLDREPSLAFAGELGLNARLIGLSVTTFGGIGPHRRYMAGGFSLDIGKIW